MSVGKEAELVGSGLGLSVLIRPQHRKQFGGLLKSLTGNDCVANQDSDVGSSQPNQAILCNKCKYYILLRGSRNFVNYS